MNCGELISKLKLYPSNTPVGLDIKNGYGILINNAYAIMNKENKPIFIGLMHENSSGYYDKDTIKLTTED